MRISCVKLYTFYFQNHYYQPLWTLVGGGVERLESSMRPTESLIPGGCTWHKTRVVEFNPDQNLVLTSNGDEVNGYFHYNYVLLQILIGLANRIW